MDAIKDLIRQNKPDDALKLASEQVRARPADAKARIALFQIMCVLGQWERALTQLSVIGGMDASTLLMVQLCRPAIQCELLRAEIFRGERDPLVLGEPPEWVGWMIQALRHTARDQHAAAGELRGRALEAAPTSGGSLEGVSTPKSEFEWIMDADSRLGPILEAIVDGRYFWVPFMRIASITLEKPSDLRDAVWMPARLVLQGGGEKVAMLPTRYPGSETSGDGAIKLARTCDWSQPDEGTSIGLGQRVLTTDAGEYALMSLSTIEFRAGGERA